MLQRQFKIEKLFLVVYCIRNRFNLLIILWLMYPIDDAVNARPINKQSSFVHNVDETKRSVNGTYSRTLDESTPSETQKAVCTVIAGDVRASAEAVTTKALKGVCGSNEMNSAFNNLESRLIKELDTIKNLLVSINAGADCDSGRIVNDIMHSQKSNPKSIVKLQPIPYDRYDNETIIFDNNKLKFKSLPDNHSTQAPIREREILVYNNTLPSEKELKIFTYYWKIENVTKKIENGSGVTIQSPIFSIKGKTLKVKASFQHLHRDFLFFQLEDDSLHAARNSIILDTGGLFKEIQNDTFKYKMSVLDQNDQQSKDLVSQEFDSHEAGFLIPNSALLDSPFIRDDSLLIKICLYL